MSDSTGAGKWNATDMKGSKSEIQCVKVTHNCGMTVTRLATYLILEGTGGGKKCTVVPVCLAF